MIPPDSKPPLSPEQQEIVDAAIGWLTAPPGSCIEIPSHIWHPTVDLIGQITVEALNRMKNE